MNNGTQRAIENQKVRENEDRQGDIETERETERESENKVTDQT